MLVKSPQRRHNISGTKNSRYQIEGKVKVQRKKRSVSKYTSSLVKHGGGDVMTGLAWLLLEWAHLFLLIMKLMLGAAE